MFHVTTLFLDKMCLAFGFCYRSPNRKMKEKSHIIYYDIPLLETQYLFYEVFAYNYEFSYFHNETFIELKSWKVIKDQAVSVLESSFFDSTICILFKSVCITINNNIRSIQGKKTEQWKLKMKTRCTLPYYFSNRHSIKWQCNYYPSQTFNKVN